jgi:hypothetical protein
MVEVKSRLTQRAVDNWESPRFQAIFWDLSFLRFDEESCPAQLPLTQTVSLPDLETSEEIGTNRR